MEKEELIKEFVKKIIDIRIKYIQYAFKKRIEQFLYISPLTELFDSSIFFKDLENQIRRKIIDSYEKDLKTFFKYLLKDLIKCYSFYEKNDLNKEISIKLLELLPKIDVQGEKEVLDKIFSVLKLLKEKSRNIIEGLSNEILVIINNNSIDTYVRSELFIIFADYLFQNNFESLITILKESDDKNMNDIKLDILKRIKAHSPIFKISDSIQSLLIDLYLKSKQENMKIILENILTKLGKMCGNPSCKKIINENKTYSEIKFCQFCDKTYCIDCLSEVNKILECNFCSKVVCQDHYKQIELENKTIPLCYFCLRNNEYKNGQIICKNCQSKMSKCSNEKCEKTICVRHDHGCFLCGTSYCPECAEEILISTRRGWICQQCREEVVNCDVCGEEIYICDYMDDYQAYQCDDCEKYLCIEHMHRVADWDKTYCKECMESWKDYVWQMETEGH